jgi:hypothetical protein
MDLASARAALPALSRSTFGETVTVSPGINDEGGWRADPARAPFDTVVQSVSIVGGAESVGGGRKSGWMTRVAVGGVSVEIDVVAFPAASLAREGDHVEMPRRHARFEIEQIDRQGRSRHVWSLVKL